MHASGLSTFPHHAAALRQRARVDRAQKQVQAAEGELGKRREQREAVDLALRLGGTASPGLPALMSSGPEVARAQVEGLAYLRQVLEHRSAAEQQAEHALALARRQLAAAAARLAALDAARDLHVRDAHAEAGRIATKEADDRWLATRGVTSEGAPC